MSFKVECECRNFRFSGGHFYLCLECLLLPIVTMVNDGCSICLELNLNHLLQPLCLLQVFCDFSFGAELQVNH